jgi:hypothetical protein
MTVDMGVYMLYFIARFECVISMLLDALVCFSWAERKEVLRLYFMHKDASLVL